MTSTLDAISAGSFSDMDALVIPGRTYTYGALAELVSQCAGYSALDAPFDVEYVRSDQAIGLLGSAAGIIQFYLVSEGGVWYIGDILGSTQQCPF